MRGITLVVEEGSLTHHALEVDKGILHMDTCDISGGLYGNQSTGITRLEETVTL